MYNCPLLAPKQTFARIVFFGKVGGWWMERALFVLNFLLKA